MEPIKPAIEQTNPATIVDELRIEIEDAIKRVLNSGRYILGEEVEAFEEEWAQWCEVNNAVGCANGTDGLELILKSLNLPKGARVLAPSHTAVATVAAIVRAGLRPYLAEVDSRKFTLNPSSVTRCIKAASKEKDPIQALIAVHLYGKPCDLDALLGICEHRGIPLIEDCSQAHGARWKGKKVGGFGVGAAFSLYPTKNLGAIGDGGIITTNDRNLAIKLKQLRQYGWKEPAVSQEPGINSRLDPIQAAILRVKLRQLGAHNAHRQAIANIYQLKLSGLENLILPVPGNDDEISVFHQYVVQVPKQRRDEIREQLRKLGIGTLLHYPLAVHQMPAYRKQTWVGIDPAGLGATEELVGRIISLPMGPHLTQHEASMIADRLRFIVEE